MSNQIEEEAMQHLGLSTDEIPRQGLFTAGPHGKSDYNERPPLPKDREELPTDDSNIARSLLRAQAAFISAQHEFMHKQDLSLLIAAQHVYIAVLTHCLSLLDRSVQAAVQEANINNLTAQLKGQGVF